MKSSRNPNIKIKKLLLNYPSVSQISLKLLLINVTTITFIFIFIIYAGLTFMASALYCSILENNFFALIINIYFVIWLATILGAMAFERNIKYIHEYYVFTSLREVFDKNDKIIKSCKPPLYEDHNKEVAHYICTKEAIKTKWPWRI